MVISDLAGFYIPRMSPHYRGAFYQYLAVLYLHGTAVYQCSHVLQQVYAVNRLAGNSRCALGHAVALKQAYSHIVVRFLKLRAEIRSAAIPGREAGGSHALRYAQKHRREW